MKIKENLQWVEENLDDIIFLIRENMDSHYRGSSVDPGYILGRVYSELKIMSGVVSDFINEFDEGEE